MLTPHIFLTHKSPEKKSLDFARDILEKLLQVPFSVYVDERGKPLVKSSVPIGISITHSGDFLALAVFPFERVGIDMEKKEDTYPTRVADRFFSDSERKKIKTSSDFYEIWSIKEAYVKMTGDGIAAISDFDCENKNENIFINSYSDKISEILGENFSFAVSCDKDFEDVNFLFI